MPSMRPGMCDLHRNSHKLLELPARKSSARINLPGRLPTKILSEWSSMLELSRYLCNLPSGQSCNSVSDLHSRTLFVRRALPKLCRSCKPKFHQHKRTVLGQMWNGKKIHTSATSRIGRLQRL